MSTFLAPARDTTLPGYQLDEELTRDERFRWLRGRRERDRAPVLVKMPLAHPATALDIAALSREFGILGELALAGVPRAIELLSKDHHCALVLEDIGGRTLADAIATERAQIGWVLDYAIELVVLLAELHRQGIVHRGIRPCALLVDERSGALRLIDFSDAARDAAQSSVPLSPRVYRSRLPYAAPEQTGRVSRVCDERTDFYALGALLYELLLGRRPFTSDDPLELIHGHIARRPAAPIELDPSIPLPLSQIVMKLLAKAAEDRYQSAQCLARDLHRCRREWSEYGRVAPFEIAQHDVADRFVVPQRLYGRDAERAALLAAFEQARTGPAALLLVAGYAGIGKTALIRDLAEPVARCRGNFVSGKFDQLSRDVPYSALIQALESLVQRMLAETPQELARRRDRLSEALGANAGVIVEVIPELALVLGDQAPAPWLPPAEAHNRFTRAFQRFLAALATPEHPLAIFLDDLQWIDPATLQLLASLLAGADVRNLLLIGAYRDNELGPEHPLLQAVAALERGSQVPISRIVLPPLDIAALAQWCADTLHVGRDIAEPLAALLLARTGGNPFFVTQFLMSLHDDGLIVFDAERSQWNCRTEAIARAAITDNVVELMSRKIDRLDAATQRVLTLAACVGNRFDAQTLATVSDQSLAATLNDLTEAAAEGLIVAEAGHSFVFLHDRVQQAAYARIAESQRPQVHLALGRLLWAAPDRGDELGFEIASHLNIGAHLIEARAEKLALARLNLAVGRKAKSAAAFSAALGYLSAGIDMLDAADWQSNYATAFPLHLEAAECAYLTGDFDAAQQRLASLLQRAATDLDRASVHSLRMVQFENLARYRDALASAREGLALFGVKLPDSAADRQAALNDEVESIRRLLGERSIASLIDRPVMDDPAMKMVMSILNVIWSPTYILGEAVLARLISAMLVRLSLAHGNTEESAYGYVTHAITVGPVREDYKSAYEFGLLALQVNERFNDTRRRAKIQQQFHAHVNLWRRPMATCIPYAREACRSGLESGDFVYAAYGAATESWPALAACQDLAQYGRDLAPNLTLVERLKNASFADVLKLNMNWGRALQGATVAPLSLTGAGFDEDAYVATYRGNPFFTMFHAIARLHLCYTLEDYEQALHAARSVQAIAHQLIGMLWSVQFDVWNALTLAANFDAATVGERADWLQQMAEAKRRLTVLAQSCPENFLTHSLLLSAELERITGAQLAALDLYERAVDYADKSGHIQHQALANELFAKFWLQRDNRRVAALYLCRALERYAQWGAHAKGKRLVERYGELLESGAGSALEPGVKPEREQGYALVDVATIVKAAHAIAENIELDDLLRQMLTIAIENAGASRGALIEEREGELFIAAAGSAESGAVALMRGTPLDSDSGCAAAVINYVFRTRASVVIADAMLDERFAQDRYIATARPRSILCLPILHQGKLGAILYLENNLARDAFSAERIEVIRILMAQAAISLENARLFERMRQEMSERQRAEGTLRAIEAGTASVTGGDFFRALVRNLARALQVRYAFVAECDAVERGERKIKYACSRAFWSGNDFGPDFEYEVPGTPCEEVLEGEVCHHAVDVQALFPADTALVTLQAQSYLGMPLLDSAGTVIGHMAILDTRPMPDAAMAISVLRLCAARAGTELERLKAEEGRERALAEIEQLKNRLEQENVYLRRELIANVSHDLRSPLASLRGYLETLQIKDRTLTAANRRAYLKIATRQAEHLQTLISELFDLARLDFQGYQISAEPMHLGELAQDVVQKFELAAQEKRIALAADIEPEVGFVRADIGLIERALENLVENALRHTPAEGAVRLAVRAHDGRFTVKLSDTGNGIPAADLPHIFERFYQVDKARTDAGGSGLGLAIVKRIVELHGAEIRVESTPGVGTSFWFALPAAAAGSA